MKNIKLLKPQPSPKNRRSPLTNITNFFHSREKQEQAGCYRAPSLSPKKQRSQTFFETETCKKGNQKLSSFQRKSPMSKVTFRSDDPRSRRTILKASEITSEMISQAHHYINTCGDMLETVNQRFRDYRIFRNNAEDRFLQVKQEIQKKRIEMLSRINQECDMEIGHQEENYLNSLSRIEEEERKLIQFQKNFQVMREDICENIKDLEGNVKMSQFRQIMDIYWAKIDLFQKYDSTLPVNCLTESSQVFVAKYLPPSSSKEVRTARSKTQAEDGKKSHGDKEFTFNKHMWNLDRARGASSWQNISPVTDSNQSIVEQRINVR